jgi:hypothetical protein
MIDSTVNASNPLDIIGSLTQPAHKTRRGRSSGAIAGVQDIADTSRVRSHPTKTGIVVEAMTD